MALALLNPTRLDRSTIKFAAEADLGLDERPSLRLDRLCDLVAELTDADREHVVDALFEAYEPETAPDPLDLVARTLVKLRAGSAADRARLAQPPRYVTHSSLRRFERSAPAST